MLMNLIQIKTKIRRLAYRIRYEYMTLNNVVMTIALIIAATWVWGAVSAMQRNFALQHNLEDKNRQLTLTQLEVETLKYQSQYYKSTEYQELTAREHYGLALPGEKLLILSPNSAKASENNQFATAQSTATVEKSNNFQQWMDFFSGKSARNLK